MSSTKEKFNQACLYFSYDRGKLRTRLDTSIVLEFQQTLNMKEESKHSLVMNR